MNTLVSPPVVRPACARPLLPSALALVMNCRRLPCPASLAFTTVSKLKPKSRPVRFVVPNVTGLSDCTAVVAVVSVASAAFVVLAPASLRTGTSPPTRSATPTGVPLEASVR